MAIVAPNTTIRLLKNVPFTKSYKYTTKFGSKTAQTDYFIRKTKYTVTEYTYQRQEEKIRVGILADDLLDCNYLMYRNTSFGNKWFYAFITNVEYVNNEMSNISFELDVMQTWQFDYTVKESFVEREHILVDTIGANRVKENLEIGDYKYIDYGLPAVFGLNQIVMACTFDKDLNPATGGMYGGVYSGLKYNVFSSYASANSFINTVTEANKIDGIISIFMLPIAFCVNLEADKPTVYKIERDKQYKQIDGYTPKNKKLFTAPYNLLYVTNNEGLSANYVFEDFWGDKCTFEITGAMSCTPEIMITPTFYKGVDKNYNERLTISNFPQCAFTVDTFKAYVAQNSMRTVMNLGMGVVQTVAGGVAMAGTGGLMGGESAVGGVTGIASTLAQLYDISTMPPQAKGSQSSIINTANEIKGFHMYAVQIRQEFAKIIDEFFNLYGYATHRIKTPNINTRPHWNYVKCIDVNIVGSVPANDMEIIRNVYNNGVTFWRNPDNIGNYSLDNTP